MVMVDGGWIRQRPSECGVKGLKGGGVDSTGRR